MKTKKGSLSLKILIILITFSSLNTLSHSLPNNTIPSNTQLSTSQYNTITQFLAPHNIVRSQLGLPPLRWSRRLANYAYWWADQRRGDCALAHSGSDYGENLFWGGGSTWTPGDAVTDWANERRYYDYYSNSCIYEECLHYTQIVWRRSLRVGCAKVRCFNGDTFISCNYDPHGNVIGERPF